MASTAVNYQAQDGNPVVLNESASCALDSGFALKQHHYDYCHCCCYHYCYYIVVIQGLRNYLLLVLAFCIILSGALCTAFSKV